MCTHRCEYTFSSPIPISDPFVTYFLSPVSSHYYPREYSMVSLQSQSSTQSQTWPVTDLFLHRCCGNSFSTLIPQKRWCEQENTESSWLALLPFQSLELGGRSHHSVVPANSGAPTPHPRQPSNSPCLLVLL